MTKNFLRGMGAAINLFPQERDIDISIPDYSNAEAFKKDLEQVGIDMYSAMKTIDINFHKHSGGKERKYSSNY